MMTGEKIEDEQHGKRNAEEPQQSPANLAIVVILFEFGFHNDAWVHFFFVR